MRIVLKTVPNQPYAGIMYVKRMKLKRIAAKTVDVPKVRSVSKTDAFLICVETVFVNLNSVKITTLVRKIVLPVVRTGTVMV